MILSCYFKGLKYLNKSVINNNHKTTSELKKIIVLLVIVVSLSSRYHIRGNILKGEYIFITKAHVFNFLKNYLFSLLILLDIFLINGFIIWCIYMLENSTFLKNKKKCKKHD